MFWVILVGAYAWAQLLYVLASMSIRNAHAEVSGSSDMDDGNLHLSLGFSHRFTTQGSVVVPKPRFVFISGLFAAPVLLALAGRSVLGVSITGPVEWAALGLNAALATLGFTSAAKGVLAVARAGGRIRANSGTPVGISWGHVGLLWSLSFLLHAAQALLSLHAWLRNDPGYSAFLENLGSR